MSTTTAPVEATTPTDGLVGDRFSDTSKSAYVSAWIEYRDRTRPSQAALLKVMAGMVSALGLIVAELGRRLP